MSLWDVRLAHLEEVGRRRPLRRAERRQLRKLYGRQVDREWRLAGNQHHREDRGSLGAIRLFGAQRARGLRLSVRDELGLAILRNMRDKGTIWEPAE